MSTHILTKLSVIPLVLGLAACGDDTGTSVSGTGTSAATEQTSTTVTSTSPLTTTMSSATTDNSGTMSASGSSTGMNPTTGPTTMTGTATDPGSTTDTSGQVGNTEPQTSSSSTSTTTDGGGSSTTDGGGSSTTSTTTDGGSSGGDNTTGQGVCLPGQGMGMGMVEKSYIWIASQDSGQISKVNTQTLIEEARYRTGPNAGGESPSRTAVSADGRYIVVNNRQTGRSTMIASNVGDCVDKNGNGMIDTSLSLNDVRAWGADECMVWSITLPYGGAWQHGPRGVTWSPGTWDYDQCAFVDPKVWMGYFSNQGNNTIHIIRVDGASGLIELTLPVPAWNGSGFAPYGAAMDNKFQPWFSSLRGEIARVNLNNNPVDVTRFPVPGTVQSYGMTVDRDGNPWIGGCSGPISVFDVEANKWVSVAGTSACHRGVASSEKYVWVASNGPCGLVQVDRKTRTLIKKHTPPQCSTAIGPSIDLEGFLWLVDQGGWAWKIDQENVQWDKKVNVAGSHYVYSDMTGGQVRDILPQ